MSTTKKIKNYKNGLETKNAIYTICKNLFYEKGYVDTTFREICQLAKVHPGTITHHFTNKNTLAVQIYSELHNQLYNQNKILFPEIINELTMMILITFEHYFLFLQDPAYRRFSVEICSDPTLLGSPNVYKEMFENLRQYISKKVSQKELDFYYAAFSGMDSNLERYISENIQDLTLNEIVKFYTKTYTMFVDTNELDKSFAEASHLFKRITVSNQGLNILIVRN